MFPVYLISEGISQSNDQAIMQFPKTSLLYSVTGQRYHGHWQQVLTAIFYPPVYHWQSQTAQAATEPFHNSSYSPLFHWDFYWHGHAVNIVVLIQQGPNSVIVTTFFSVERYSFLWLYLSKARKLQMLISNWPFSVSKSVVYLFTRNAEVFEQNTCWQLALGNKLL